MPVKIRDLISQLEKAGFRDEGGKGSHRNFRHPTLAGKITVSGRPGDDAKRYQERDVRIWLRKASDAKRS